MFGIDSGEILIIAVVALVVIGPKDLPRVMRTIGNFVGRARGMAKHFRSGLDTMMREAELEEMEKKWRADNERIMREHPLVPPPAVESAAESDWGKPLPEEDKAGEAQRPKPKAPPRPAQGASPMRNAPPAPPSGEAP
ncbi:MAG TPA: Sec-independent protein translocase protein TatB [Allosphingosinicella sp.]|nr:Sec-independent protein translocase protein TatB [Allosphingosinicella sp.]